MRKLGWAMIGLFGLFMLGASVLPKFAGMEAAATAMTQIGYPLHYLLMIGILEMIATLLVIYLRTALAGGIMMTAILGGAIASQLRVEAPLVSHTLFGAYLGVFMWTAICLRDPRIIAALTGRRSS